MAQWQGLLQNLGTWQGSFTQLSAAGVEVSDAPSQLTLALSKDGQTVTLTLKRLPPNGAPQETVLPFRYPGPGSQIPFFDNGCFSQGSLQWSSWSQFGAELALGEGGLEEAGAALGDRRLRLVQLFQPGTDFSSLTLIREQRLGSGAQASPPLTVPDLVGTWQGEAQTLYPDGRAEAFATHLTVTQSGDRLSQSLQFGSHQIASTARIDGNCLQFEAGVQPMQLLLLPGGASSLCPRQIQAGFPFVLEAGWLITPHLRRRLVRNYSDRGDWVSLTVITERKQA